MSNPMLCCCLVSDCTYNQNKVYADAQQVRKHYWTHSYSELLQTARNVNLIQEYVCPNKNGLVDILFENSKVEDKQI